MTDPFLGPWTIQTWEKEPDALPEIPGNGFKEGGPLNITQLDPDSIELVWLNRDDQPCLATGLQYNQSSNQLEGSNISVDFAGDLVPCDLTVEMVPDTSDTKLRLKINQAGGSSLANSHGTFRPEVGGGVVTAIANG